MFFTSKEAESRKYLFVSDIHGYDPVFFEALTNVLSKGKAPEIVFFLGDIVGTVLLDQLQKLFYNQVVNPMKTIFKATANPTDEEILLYPIDNRGNTISTGCEEIWEFLRLLDPDLEPINRANYARELVKYVHYGHFISNLSSKIKGKLRNNLLNNAEHVYKVMEKFTDAGSFVVLIEGNWDARNPLDFEIGMDCVATSIEKREFIFSKFIASKNNKNILYVDNIHILKTDHLRFVLLPFDSAIEYHRPSLDQYYHKGEKTILVSHAQASWWSVFGNPNKENQEIIQNMVDIIYDIRPDTIIHGHTHNKLVDDNGKTVSGYYYDEDIPVEYLPYRSFRFIDL